MPAPPIFRPLRLSYSLLASRHIGHIRPSSWEPANPRRAVDETLDYYELRLVGQREIVFSDGVAVNVRFNREEIHLFTSSERAPSAAALAVERPGKGGETRYFDIARARRLDEIVDVIRAPAACLPANDRNGIVLIGPHSPDAGQRIAVVLSQSSWGEWYVRTSYGMTPKSYAAALRNSRGRTLKWPPE